MGFFGSFGFSRPDLGAVIDSHSMHEITMLRQSDSAVCLHFYVRGAWSAVSFALFRLPLVSAEPAGCCCIGLDPL